MWGVHSIFLIQGGFSKMRRLEEQYKSPGDILPLGGQFDELEKVSL